MQQVRIFKSIESELHPLEDQINQWIKESGIKIISVTGNIAGQSPGQSTAAMSSFSASDVLVIVLYETS